MLLRMLGSLFNGTARPRHEPANDTAPGHPSDSMTSRLTRAPSVESACKVCGGPSSRFDVVDFNKHCADPDAYQFGLAGVPVYYSRCLDCGFIFTRHFDGWDAARFATDIYNDDYVKVDAEYTSARPLRAADHFAAAFPDARSLSILDYGAGSGIFAARLKELGFSHVESFDPYSQPQRPGSTFDIVTCVEVMEHAPDPHATMRDMLSFANARTRVVFTTLTQPDDIEVRRGAWWYIAPRNGHVSIYSDRSLDALAAGHGLYFFPGEAFHIFAREAGGLSKERALFNVPFYAPDEDAQGWHAVEHHAGSAFRWTADEVIAWPFSPRAVPCVAHVRIPLIMEAEAGLAARCMVRYETHDYSVGIVGMGPWRALAARIELDALQDSIELVIPTDTMPAKDGRRVGIAVPLHIAGRHENISATRNSHHVKRVVT